MHDDIAELFGLAPIGGGNVSTHHGGAVDRRPNPEAWRDDAACHPRHKPDGMTMAVWVGQWFPGRGDRLDRLRAICAACPALEPCQADALARNDVGFQGGLSERERRRRRSPKQASRTRQEVAYYLGLGWTDEQVGRRVGLTRRGVQSARRDLGLKKDQQGRLLDEGDAA